MKVRDIMSKPPIHISPIESAEVAARTLAHYNIGVLPVCGSTAGHSSSDSSATTAPQTVVSYFPEFYYKTYWRLLDQTRSGYYPMFEFKSNEFSTYRRRTHFTPVWFPDGTYRVYSYVMDCWTPDGMLCMNLSDSVGISGSLWDDWHIAPVSNQ